MNRGRKLLGYILPPLAALFMLLIAWELYVDWRNISIIVVPPPSEVAERLFEDPGFFWEQAWYTLYEATLGLVIGSALAIGLAIVMAHSQTAERTVMPLALSLKMTPLVAIGPVLVIALGFGTEPKVAMAALLCFFPTLVNAITGFRDINTGALDFMRSINASGWQVFWKLRLPSALPYLFAALKVTYPLALTGAVVAEWFVGNRGLGLVIYRANSNLDTPTLFAAIAVLALTGIVIYGIISLVERRVLFWHESVRNTH
jgi:ABC-type nitrate/sulfonate/bicarbonate transport system permease component